MVRRTFCKVLLAAVVAVFSLFVFSGALFAQGNSAAAFDRVADVQERHTEALMAKPGVVGTAVGLDDDGGYAVLVFLENPGVGGIPQDLEGVPVRVVVTGKFFALAPPAGKGRPPRELNPTSRWPRPVPIGISTGHPDITAGTIGCRVVDGPGNFYALSNNHVYANQNGASIGDAVIQPGDIDGGKSPADDIGTLHDFKWILFGGSDNEIDAAIATVTKDDFDGNGTPELAVDRSTPLSDGYGTPSSTTVSAYLGQPVQKYGRTTGLTTGYVDAVSGTFDINYGGGNIARFVNQIVIIDGSFSAGGDSGSLVVTNDDRNNPVGLLFAGNSSHTIASPIDAVLGAFTVSVDGPDVAPDNPPNVDITSPGDGDTVDSGAPILFLATANDEDGDLAFKLVWTSNIQGEIGSGGSFSRTLVDGIHIITASVTDNGNHPGRDSVSITVGTSSSGQVTATISYDRVGGGRNHDKDLAVTVELHDDDEAVGGASVSILLELNIDGTTRAWTATSTTGGDGFVTFTLSNAPFGCYTTDVTKVNGVSFSNTVDPGVCY